MRAKRILTFATALLTCAYSLVAQNCLPVKKPSPQNLPFEAGEELSYTMHYKWNNINADVGKAVTSIDTVTLAGEKVFTARLFGRTARFFDVFFKVREDFRSWFSYETLKPRKFIRDTKEGGYYAYDVYRYDWSSGVIKASLDNKKYGKRYRDIEFDNCTYDLPALLYFARTLDFSKVRPGVPYPVSFSIDDDTYTVRLTMYGAEDKYIKGLGTVRCVKFGCSLVAGVVFSGEEDAVLWISDDDNHLVVAFEAPILRSGLASGRLSAYNGLKHPFKALKQGS